MGTYDIFFTKQLYEKDVYHEVESGLTFLKYLGGKIESDALELWVSQEDKDKVKTIFDKLAIENSIFKIIVNLSTSAEYKDWPVEYYAEVCNRIQKDYSVVFLLIGAGETAQKYAENYMKYVPQAYNLVNRITVRQTIEVMRHSDLYLGGDTGPVHMAAACGLGGVAIYSTSKDYNGDKQSDASCWFAPWKSSIIVVQPDHALPGCEHGCNHNEAHCICQMKPDQVYAELIKQLRVK